MAKKKKSKNEREYEKLAKDLKSAGFHVNLINKKIPQNRINKKLSQIYQKQKNQDEMIRTLKKQKQQQKKGKTGFRDYTSKVMGNKGKAFNAITEAKYKQDNRRYRRENRMDYPEHDDDIEPGDIHDVGEDPVMLPNTSGIPEACKTYRTLHQQMMKGNKTVRRKLAHALHGLGGEQLNEDSPKPEDLTNEQCTLIVKAYKSQK